MMRHDPRFFVFQSAYLNEIAKFDIQNAFLEEDMEDQLFRLFAHVSLTRDPRARRDMVPSEVWANLQPDPEIVELEERRAELKQGRYRFDGREHAEEIRRLTYTIQLKRSQRESRIVKQYREYYFYNRPTWDLERQARGDQAEEYLEPAIDLVIPERRRLANIFCNQPKDLVDEERTRLSIEVVDLYVALCGKKETIKRTYSRPIFYTKSEEIPESCMVQVKSEEDPDPTPGPFPLLMDANQCPECIGDERLTLGERTFRYCRPTKRNDHFDDHHLEAKETAEQFGQLIVCKDERCKNVKFSTVDHFRNHVYTVHKITLRTSEQVRQRRARKAKLRRSRS
jgi:hypothetical protein